jgi:hypothetical protein
VANVVERRRYGRERPLTTRASSRRGSPLLQHSAFSIQHSAVSSDG